MASFSKDSTEFMNFMYSDIQQNMHTCIFDGKDMFFLLTNDFRGLSTNTTAWLDHLQNISTCFRKLFESDPALKDVVINERSKTLLIGVYSKFSPESLTNMLSYKPLFIEPGDATPLPIPDELISEDERRRYIELSPHFLPVKFTRGNYSREISADEVLPILGFADADELGNGAAGMVLRVHIDDCYHNFPTGPRFALKCFDDPEHAKREAQVLEKVMVAGSAPHLHIAEIYCGFHFSASYYLIAECAQQNLEEFMEHSDNRQVSSNWLRSQLRGLAEALHVIHISVTDHSICHHDFTFHNFLVFTDSNKIMFKITDWGCATIKPLVPGEDSPRSFTESHTHSPPEARDGPCSRPRDVWSLGCLFVEILIWQTRGWDALEMFRDECFEEHVDDWCVEGEKVLLPCVIEQLNVLGQGEWTNEAQVICQMLNVNPKERILAGDVARTLD